MFALLLSIFAGCKKNDNNPANCFSNAATVRQIINRPAAIHFSGGQYYVIEQNTIDTRLRPCYLSPEFMVDGLQVIVSGDVKETAINSSEPCCTDDFIITKISR
jgi:hypothetical protein